jgi:hypothetical protein
LKGGDVSQKPYDYSTREGIHPISWEDFHGLCKAPAAAVSSFQIEQELTAPCSNTQNNLPD